MSRTDARFLAKSFVLLTGAFALTSAPCAEQATKTNPDSQVKAYATIRFWEEVNDDGEVSGTNICNIYISANELPYFKKGKMGDFECDNDEAKAMEVENLPAGSTVELFDDPGCGKHDDWVKVTIEKQRPKITISDFEITRYYPMFSLIYVTEPPPPHFAIVWPTVHWALQEFHSASKTSHQEAPASETGRQPYLALPIIDGPASSDIIARKPKTQKSDIKDALNGKVSCAIIDIPGPVSKASASKD